MTLRVDGVTRTSAPALIRATARCIDAVFPAYAPAHLPRRLRLGPDTLQIFVVREDERVIAFVQCLYRSTGDRLIVDIDLLGTLPAFRRRGFASVLFHHVMGVAADRAHARGQVLVGALTLIDDSDPAIRALHRKHGGDIRTDRAHRSGDVVVWYPVAHGAGAIPTDELLAHGDAFGEVIRAFTDGAAERQPDRGA